MSEAALEHERIVVVRDDASGLHAIIAIHSTRRGPAFGGIRRWCYPDETAALADVRGLARAMSRKCALAGLPAGGAKTVVLVPPARSTAPHWPAAYRALGRAIDELGGRYVCGPDVGTGPSELGYVRQTTRHVNPVGNDAGASTAAGVLAGIRTMWRVIEAGSSRRAAIQGLGAVGLRTAMSLVADGVSVCGADPDPEASARAEARGVRIVDPSAILFEPCDVLVPCAMGHVFDVPTVQALRCRAICGSANEQLVSDAAAWALHRRGIVHAPDIVVSAGAVIEGVLTVVRAPGSAGRSDVHEAIDGIDATLARVLEQASRENLPPSCVAARLADAAIASAPPEALG